MQQDQLGFLVCLPRTGSTVLADSFGLHSRIYCPPEPHLLYPLFHLGYFRKWYNEEVQPGRASSALCALINELPRGSDDYLEALRAYADTIYSKLLTRSGKELFIDKSATYTDNDYLPLVERLYPRARYVILVRQPIDIALSMYQVGALWGWGDGSTRVWNVVRRIKDGFATLAQFAARRPDAIVVRYEDMIAAPQEVLTRVCGGLGYGFEAAMMERQRYVKEYWVGLGDPSSFAQRTRLGEGTHGRAELQGMHRLYVSQMLSALGGIDPACCDVFGYSVEQIRSRAREYAHAAATS